MYLLGTSVWLIGKLWEYNTSIARVQGGQEAGGLTLQDGYNHLYDHPIHSSIILDAWKADNKSFPRAMSASNSLCSCCSHKELLGSFSSFYQLHLQLVTLQLIQIVFIISVPRYQCTIQAIWNTVHERFKGVFLLWVLPLPLSPPHSELWWIILSPLSI